VGEFGVIINNQDQYLGNPTFSISNIISNKYKVNLRSIDDVMDYYWVCGDEGVLLKISKIYFTIEQFDLGEDLNLTSVSFFDDLYGMVVGKFNTIYFTRDGGWNWTKLIFDEFEQYSYNKVLHTGPNQVYIGGETGVFIELTYSNQIWTAYRRSVTKVLDVDDEYGLVEDINDIYKTNFVNFETFTFSDTSSSITDFAKTIVYSVNLQTGNQLEITISLNSSITDFYIFGSFSYPNGSGYLNGDYGIDTFSLLNLGSRNLGVGNLISSFILPINSDGNIYEGTYSLSFAVWDNSVDAVNYSRSVIDFQFKTKSGNILFISANNENVIAYDINRCINTIDNDFIYLSFPLKIKDSISIARRPLTTEIYFGSEKIYRFDLCSLRNSTSSISNVVSINSIDFIEDYFINKIFTTEDRILLCGNSSFLKIGTYSFDSYGMSFIDLDPTFNSRIKSRFLVLDYDIGSKLNFFDDNRNYRLPDSVSINSNTFTQPSSTFSISSISGEYSWIDYFSDSEKTFAYNTHMEDGNIVKFSNQFTYDEYTNSFTISNIGITLKDFQSSGQNLAPHFDSSVFSEFIFSADLATEFKTDKDLLLYKNLAIIKRSFIVEDPTSPITYTNFSDKTKVGDVYRLTSDVVDTNLVVNSILYFAYPDKNGAGKFTQSKPGIGGFVDDWEKVDAFLYCYSNFNETIINNLKKTTSPITLKNLNRYKDQDDLVSNFNIHPYGTGYKLTNSGGDISISALFNEKTAYYNLQSKVEVSDQSKDLLYKESFLDFGFTPTYNILSYLTKINPEVFIPTKEFRVLPKLSNLVGNNKNDALDSNLTIDSNRPSNWIRFGKDYYLEWQSLFINTFIDIKISSDLSSYNFYQYLITEKYYD
jgi:hypothetical protein